MDYGKVSVRGVILEARRSEIRYHDGCKSLVYKPELKVHKSKRALNLHERSQVWLDCYLPVTFGV